MNTEQAVATMWNSGTNNAATPRKNYKSVPENYKALSECKYHRVIADLETVLLDISTDGVGLNAPDGRISASTLNSWAERLRDALETLSKAH